MTVDFVIKRAPAYRVASIRWKGPWSDAGVQRKFNAVVAWARGHDLKTGRWIFREPAERSFEVAIEVIGKAKSDRTVRIRTFPASTVASVVYDPKVIEPRVVYHGLTDWLRWRRKEGEIRSVGDYREVYTADPWTDAKAYAHTEVQIVVRK
ncbi:MAG: GyrI-like domain-containing protein [Thermoplasmata archaeon]|jgi:effector-binding domain-containing protein